MKNSIILFIALLSISFGSFAIDKSDQELKGDKYFFLYAFDKAVDAYSRANELTIEGTRRFAASYVNLELNADAEIVYAKLVTLPNVLPEDFYNYAMVLKINGKYETSNLWMDKFAAQKPADLRAKDYVAHAHNLEDYLSDDGKYKINTMEVNTVDYDFGPAYYKNQLVFTSSRSRAKMIVKNDNWTGEPYMNLYVADIEVNQMKSPKKFGDGINSNLHDGPISFSNDGMTMAFTQNNHKDKSEDKIVELQIYFSSTVDGEWSEPESFILNGNGYSVGHPCLTNDGQTMYFTSDMPGGFGGTDIYKISRDQAGNWGPAVNMGENVNTEGDEMFPFFEEKNEVLFFSSNGRFGLGGLDIFISQPNGNAQTYNAGAPMNTQYDDFALIIDDSLGTGYFSSNRTGGAGNADIYAFDVLKRLDIDIKINGVAKDKDYAVLAETYVTLTDEFENVLASSTTGADGSYSFLVNQNEDYKLIGQKENYLDGMNRTTTNGNEYVIIADVILAQKMLKEEVVEKEPVNVELAVNNNDLGQILKINTAAIYFDFNASDIRPDATVELDKIIKYMNENPTVIIELSSYTDCRGNNEYNRKLANKRAVSTLNYIKAGITNPDRISGKGYGETETVNDCECEGALISSCSDDEFQENRRTEFLIVKK